MKVKCISPRLNHVVFGTDGNGKTAPHRVRVGETFKVKGIPKEWEGLVVAVGEEPAAKVAVTNPADEELNAMRESYKELTGNPAHHTWDKEKLAEKLAELTNSETD